MGLSRRLEMNYVVTIDEVYENILSVLSSFFIDDPMENIVIDFSHLHFIYADSLLPLLRAFLVGAKYLRTKNKNFRFEIEDSDTNAFLYLFHAKFFDALDDYVDIPDFQRNRILYNVRNTNYNKENAIISFETFSYYVSLIREINPSKWADLTDEEMKEQKEVRNEIASFIHWNIRALYENLIERIEKQYGGDYIYKLKSEITELASNAIIHSESNALLYFQIGALLPKLSAINKKDIKGAFISVGDTGHGFDYSLRNKTDRENYLSDFRPIKDECQIHFSDTRTNTIQRQALNDAWELFEALFYSKYKEKTKHVAGLFRLIDEVTDWNGIVTISYGNIEISFGSMSEFVRSSALEEDIDFKPLFTQYLDLIYNNKNVPYCKILHKRIPGVQINVEVELGGSKA